MASRMFWMILGMALSIPLARMYAGEGAGAPAPQATEPRERSSARDLAILADSTLFPPTVSESARPVLAHILSSAGHIEPQTLPLAPPFPTLHHVLQTHGAPDHVFEQGEGHVHVFGHLGLVTGSAEEPDGITALWLQGRNFAHRSTVLAGNTYRQTTSPEGRLIRIFYIRDREAARWEREREGMWREVGGSLRPGIYRRHWDETDAPDDIHVTEAGVERRLYYRNGQLYQSLPFRNHAWHGTSRVHYPSGRVERELPLQAGRLHGDVVTYAPDGRVTARIPYREGVRHGVSRAYYPNGATRHAIPYEEGVMQGTAQHFSVHGRLIRETPFVQGTLSGVEKEYGMDGTLRRTQMYRAGKPVGEPMRFSRQGKPLPRMQPEDYGHIDSEILTSPAEARARQRDQEPDTRSLENTDTLGVPTGDAPPSPATRTKDATTDDPGLTRRVWERMKFWGTE